MCKQNQKHFCILWGTYLAIIKFYVQNIHSQFFEESEGIKSDKNPLLIKLGKLNIRKTELSVKKKTTRIIKFEELDSLICFSS
jgi:hypothetical protein